MSENAPGPAPIMLEAVAAEIEGFVGNRELGSFREHELEMLSRDIGMEDSRSCKNKLRAVQSIIGNDITRRPAAG